MLLKLLEPLAMFLDHPQVVRGGEGGLALGKEVIAGEARANLDEFAGLADVGNGVGQEDGDVAVLGPQRMVLPPLDAGLAGRAGDRLLGFGRIARLALGLGAGRALALGLAALGLDVLAMNGLTLTQTKSGMRDRLRYLGHAGLMLARMTRDPRIAFAGRPDRAALEHAAQNGISSSSRSSGLPGAASRGRGWKEAGAGWRPAPLPGLRGSAGPEEAGRRGAWSRRGRVSRIVVARRTAVIAGVAPPGVEELHAIGLDPDLRPLLAGGLVVPGVHPQGAFHVDQSFPCEDTGSRSRPGGPRRSRR